MADVRTRNDWTTEDAYWRENYSRRPYVESGRDYEFYQPGYRFGYDSAERYPEKDWDAVERDLSDEWDRYEHRNRSTWQQMKDAVRDAWDRMTGKR
jgi:hypothetical protein